jgi:mRNA interferase RelE/StbE
MNVVYRKNFIKDLSALKNKKLKASVEEVIFLVKNAKQFEDIKNLTKLKGHRNYYRIRIGNYRIGVALENNIVEFILMEKRSDFYRRFP